VKLEIRNYVVTRGRLTTSPVLCDNSRQSIKAGKNECRENECRENESRKNKSRENESSETEAGDGEARKGRVDASQMLRAVVVFSVRKYGRRASSCRPGNTHSLLHICRIGYCRSMCRYHDTCQNESHDRPADLGGFGLAGKPLGYLILLVRWRGESVLSCARACMCACIRQQSTNSYLQATEVTFVRHTSQPNSPRTRTHRGQDTAHRLTLDCSLGHGPSLR